jgi:hypothetical protein
MLGVIQLVRLSSVCVVQGQVESLNRSFSAEALDSCFTYSGRGCMRSCRLVPMQKCHLMRHADDQCTLAAGEVH